MKQLCAVGTCGWMAAALSLTAFGQAPNPAPTSHVISQKQQVEVRQGTVAYVSGNDLVVKMKDGSVKHFNVPPDTRFKVDGKDVATKDLKPGTALSQTITTTTKDTTVTSVRNIDAKVRMVSPPYLTVTLADGTTKRVKVPEDTKFTVDGQSKTVFDLKEGMQLKGTIVTKDPEVVISTTASVVGKAPKPAASKTVATPSATGVLLIEEDIAVPAR